MKGREPKMGRGKIHGMRFMMLLLCGWLASSLAAVPARAQQRLNAKTQSTKTEAAAPAQPESERAGAPSRLRAQLAEARSEYKSSLEQLRALYERSEERRVG